MTTAICRKSRWTPLGVVAMILGFAVWWPLGLAVIGYILWGGSVDDLFNEGVSKIKEQMRPQRYHGGSGNAAFDEYRRETLRRLEEEQAEFSRYVDKLRQARDRDEFERFMSDRKADPVVEQ